MQVAQQVRRLVRKRQPATAPGRRVSIITRARAQAVRRAAAPRSPSRGILAATTGTRPAAAKPAAAVGVPSAVITVVTLMAWAEVRHVPPMSRLGLPLGSVLALYWYACRVRILLR